jgi:hypothetical protein
MSLIKLFCNVMVVYSAVTLNLLNLRFPFTSFMSIKFIVTTICRISSQPLLLFFKFKSPFDDYWQLKSELLLCAMLSPISRDN